MKQIDNTTTLLLTLIFALLLSACGKETDTTPPVLTLNGEATITLEQNAAYTELGATAVDAVDGNLSVYISGAVDTGTVGHYVVKYSAIDSAWNEAHVTRSISVVDTAIADTTPPMITLNGQTSVTLEQNTAYTELGATARDAVDGNVSVGISGNVDTSTVGIYTMTYSATDHAGNTAHTTRDISVVAGAIADTTPPLITLNGQANTTLEQNAVYTEFGATALDTVDGNVSVTIDGTVDTATVGSYTVTYSARDASGNEANATRGITVVEAAIIDVTPPVLTLNGEANITLEQNTAYIELGATARDAVDGNVSVNISGNVDTSTVGIYTMTYSATDHAGNTAHTTRDISVVAGAIADTTPPLITLNGQANTTLEQNAVYTEFGATALDTVDGNVSVSISGTVDTATVGHYVVTYTATDSVGNESSVTRSIEVANTTPMLTSLSLESNTITVNKAGTVRLSVMGTYSDNSTKPLTSGITWIITPSDAVTIRGNTLTTLKDGNVTVQAKVGTTLSNKVTLNIYWEVNGHRLPPEPDPAVNNSTLLGVDVNHNDVRDDVERWIYEKYKDKHPIYIDIAMQAARGYRLVLEIPEKAKEIYLKVDKAIDCQAYYKYSAKYYGDPILIKNNAVNEYFRSSVYFNTKDRMEAYDKYDTLLSGDSYTLPNDKEKKAACDFNTSKYEE